MLTSNQATINKNSYGLYSFSKSANSIDENFSINEDQSFKDDVNKKCEDLIETGKKEVKQVIEKAYLDGEKSGFEETLEPEKKKAYDIASHQYKEILDNLSILNASLNMASTKRNDPNVQMEKTLDLLKKIIDIELKTNDEVYFGIYKKAAQHVSSVQTATLKSSKHGAEVARNNLKKYIDQIDSLQELKIEETEEKDGYCYLQTELGNIDSSVEKQLDRAIKIVKP